MKIMPAVAIFSQHRGWGPKQGWNTKNKVVRFWKEETKFSISSCNMFIFKPRKLIKEIFGIDLSSER